MVIRSDDDDSGVSYGGCIMVMVIVVFLEVF